MQEILIPTTSSEVKHVAKNAIDNRSLLYDRDSNDLYVKYNDILNEIGGGTSLSRLSDVETDLNELKNGNMFMQFGSPQDVDLTTTWVAPCSGILFWFFDSLKISGCMPVLLGDTLNDESLGNSTSTVVFYPFVTFIRDQEVDVTFDETSSNPIANLAVTQKFNSLSNYNLSESSLGKWVDGSQIYQRTIRILDSSPVDVSLWSISMPIEISGFAKKNSGEFVGIHYGDSSYHTYTTDTSIYPLYVSYDSSSKKLLFNSDTSLDYDIEYGYVTIKYVK